MASVFPLHALFQALHKAVIHATKVAGESSLQSLKKDYFDPVLDDAGKPTGSLVPKTIELVLPTVENGDIKPVPYRVPLYSLVKHRSVAMDTMKIEFDVELHGFSDTEEDADHADGQMLASTPSGVFSRKTVAKVEVTFKGEDPAEGMLRLNDKILKTFPS